MPDSRIRILSPIAELDYFDSQSTELPRDVRPLEVWNLIMARPQPVLKAAFQVRDAISSCFGVKRIGGFSRASHDTVAVGDRLDFFLVEYSDDTSLVLTERDRHLDVMTCISVEGPTVAVTSSVRIHNWFGRAYMIPVGIAHKWIVRGMLRHLHQSVTAAA